MSPLHGMTTTMTELSATFPDALREREDPAPPAAGVAALSALRPLIEGARARGVADACEMLGLAAILLNRGGEVLHLTSAASALMGEPLRLAGGHVVAADAEANQTIERMVGAALSGAPGEGSIASRGAGSLRLRALPLPGARDDETQLLKALLVLAPGATASAPAVE